MNKNHFSRLPSTGPESASRRDLLKMTAAAGAVAAIPFAWTEALASTRYGSGVSLERPDVVNPDWMSEARIFGLPVTGLKVDRVQLATDLDSALRQGANVIEADSRLSDYISEREFETELKLISDSTAMIHERGLKVVWYIPSLEVITPNGRLREDTIARQHPEWLQLSFDRKRRGVFYGKRVFWVEKNDESAWMCPNSPYRDWLHGRLSRLAATGVDGVWLDVPLFGLVVGKWGCACGYCREKFSAQTGLEFPDRFDLTDKRFWQYVQWRHRTLTEFVDSCRQVITAANPAAVTIAEVVALDHLGATEWGTEGSQMSSHYVVWEQDGASESTAMADASYDDWVAQFSSYKYCRGATMGRPSWAFSYGFNDADAQLVMAATVAAQNNPYELRTPKMTTTVGMEFRGMMYNWIATHSKQVFKSRSVAPVAIVYSARNRDFLDTRFQGGLIVSGDSDFRDRRWLGSKPGSPRFQEYMGDYRGLSLMLYQNHVPADIYPIDRADADLLSHYPVLVLPYMASLGEDEKEMLIARVRDGATLIVSGPNSGEWHPDGTRRPASLWSEYLQDGGGQPVSHAMGRGRICLWREEVGRNWLRSHAAEVSAPVLGWMREAGVEPWTTAPHKAIVQPYVYRNQIVVHVLNYTWTGGIYNEPAPLWMNLVVPWKDGNTVRSVEQSEPGWSRNKTLEYTMQPGKLVIPLQVGINALVIINT